MVTPEFNFFFDRKKKIKKAENTETEQQPLL